MPKEMPGFQEHADDVIAKQSDATEKASAGTKNKKFLKVQLKKLSSVLRHTSKKNPAFADFLKTFAKVQGISFLIGSMAFLFSGRTQFEDSYGNPTGGLINNPLNEVYGDDMSYIQAIKNAYLLEDWRNGNDGVFQGICGLLSMVIALILATRAGADKVKSNLIKSREILHQLDELKKYGINATQLIKDLEPDINKLISKISEKDRGYFDNLIAGGLDTANYETCVAIVSGHLKSHPKEYSKLVEIIDEATLPDVIKNKYGKEQMISFAAAKELNSER